MSLLQYFRAPFAIMVAATLYGCSADSEQPFEGKEFVEVPALSAATDKSHGKVVTDQEVYTGALVHLSLDDSETGSTATDSSGNSNNGAITGAVYAANSVDGSTFSLDFDGVDDGVSLGTLDVSGSGVTLAAWVNAETFPGTTRDPRIISKASGTSNDDHVFMLGTIKRGNETTLRGRLRVNGVTHTLIADEGVSLLTGSWYHMALVHDGSRMTLYLNGEEVGGKSIAGDIDQDNTVEVAIGKNPDGSRYWDGLIDEVLILERPISATELGGIVEGAIVINLIEQIDVADSQPEIPTEQESEQSAQNQPAEEVAAPDIVGPVGPAPEVSTPIEYTPIVTEREVITGALVHLSLDDSETGSTATDSSGNSNNGAITGAVYAANSVDGSTFSLDFDGVDDGVSLGTLDVSGSGVTLAAWVNAETFPGTTRDPRIISKASGTSNDDHVFMLGTIKRGNETTLRGRLRVNGVTHTLIADEGVSLLTGSWYHMALVHDGSRMTLYLNGEEVGGKSIAGDIDQDNTVEVAIGKNPDGSRYWDGLIDEVLILERPISATELGGIVEGAIVINLIEQIDVADSQPEIPTEQESEQSAQNQPAEEVATPDDVAPIRTTELETLLGASNVVNNIAFPGALGWAAETTSGGRGGRVVIVDTLSNDVDPHDGVTSFREAMTEINEPRIIVFSVAGLIDYRSGPGVPGSQIVAKSSDSDVTIACHSAPPPGITLMGDGIRFAGDINNVIVRQCRFRNSDPVNVGSAENSSCIRVIGSSPNDQGEVQRNFIVDHVSCMWAADDPVVFSTPLAASATGGSQKNITVSNSIVSEGDADSLHEESGQLPNRYEHSHGIGCTSASDNKNIRIRGCSIVRNFIAHNSRRNPQFWNVDKGEVINNIIYNSVEVGISALPQRGTVDGLIIGNLIQLGPTSKANAREKAIDLRTNNSRLTISGNYLGEYGGSSVSSHDGPVNAEFATPSTTQQVTPDLDILEISRAGSNHLRCIGASRPRRDSHDQRVIDEFHQQSGQAGIMQQHERDFSEYLNGPTDRNWTDSDRDGMPDTWETKMAIDDPSRYDLSADYTNIEVYLNRLARCPSVTFDADSLSFPAGTREIDVPFHTTWETWPDGQHFELCVDNECQKVNDPTNKGAVSASLPADGEYQLTLIPINSDGVRERIYASIQLNIGNAPVSSAMDL